MTPTEPLAGYELGQTRATHTICLFIPTGRTFTFRNARITTDNETVLVIEYVAMSDGRPKTITVQKTQVVGWAVS